MKDPLRRNMIVAFMGTPKRTEGSLNSPVELEEDGLRFNEKWVYEDLEDDPSGAAMRAVYWHRYDFVGTRVRNSLSEPWRDDTRLAEALAHAQSREAPHDPERHKPTTPSAPYRPVSKFKGKPDLGGRLAD